jgi:hypothetical protein
MMDTKSWRMGVYPVQNGKKRPMRLHEALNEIRLFNHNEAADAIERVIHNMQNELAREQGYL